ncbi:tumor necrosis factor alpha-induced protein 2-like isoform X2 [Hoplias malabaricus]|uniref:tumor necrosis factor alpha-induced protein 2-like isoform X2 n=1 Tax=Hoplias malabaricus TaxID=27720 RepID=UPI0034618FAD
MKNMHFPALSLRRKSKDVLGSPEALSSNSPDQATSEEQPEKSPNGASDEKGKNKNKIRNRLKISRFMKRHNAPNTVPEIPVVLDFNQNLEMNYLAEASQQLIAREEQLFSSETAEDIRTEDEEDKMQKDYEMLKLHLWIVIQDSFNKDNQEPLKSAVKAICQEEERDHRWEEAADDERPIWRPVGCRKFHDTLLQKVVKIRIQKANEEESGADKLSTSIKKDVCRMGKRIQNDLLCVVRDVQGCYTPDYDVCQMYTQLYHKAFSTKLQELSQSNLDVEDCIYILSWINIYFPNDILQQKELASHINSETLGPLLTEEDLKSLEEQYLSHKEAEVSGWLSNALKKEEEHWQSDTQPEQMDGYFISNLALDVINLLDAAKKEVITVMGNESKAQRILLQLGGFLSSYKKSLAEFLKGKNKNISDTLKSNLVSIQQAREYIEQQENLPADDKQAWLSIVEDLGHSCHRYFLDSIHKELKDHYRKLWTPVWFAESQNIIGDLLKSLEDQMKPFTSLKPSCTKELVSQLHIEVMREYVRRMLKRKLKLKDKDEQDAAATFLCEDNIRINGFFIKTNDCGFVHKVHEV